ncbi:MAG: VCBS repeat-containing protein, partial [Pyrinomonadaceae bacterium]|nr:VCBS repeat-containing protein [Pyrinomonadaceae bacterium]
MRPSRWFFAIATSFVIALSMSSTTSAQAPLLVENFNYPAGSLLTANGWTAHSGAGTNALATVSPALTYTGYPSSGLGNAVALTTSGEDAHKTYAVQSSGSVYAALLVNLSEASADPAGGYFFHLGPDPISTTFRGRLFAKKDASNNVAFGISKALTAQADIAYTPFSYALNTTYLIVVKYTIVDGATNDTVSIYINPTLNAEPASATATATDISQTDVNIGSVALRQGSAATAPTAKVGGLRIGTTWASVMTGSTPTAAQNVVDFDGDGKTDFTVVRNIQGIPDGQVRWFTNFNSSATTQAFDWGLATDFFVPADYDGDNKTDIAVWRPISNNQGSGNALSLIHISEPT